MPHVIVKLWPGKSDTQKQELSAAIVRSVTGILNYGDDAVSVAFEEIQPADWTTHVHGPDIRDRWDTLIKVPGYGPEPKQTQGE